MHINDLRIIISFFILKNYFCKNPFIKKFTKIYYEIEGKKFNKVLYLCDFSISNINKFLFFDFFFDCIYTFFLYNLMSFVIFSIPSDFRFMCALKFSNFIPGLTEKFFLYNVLFSFNFFFSHLYFKSMKQFYISNFFSLNNLLTDVK